jgi:hypothetical protein
MVQIISYPHTHTLVDASAKQELDSEMKRLVYLISAFFILTEMYGEALSADETKGNGYINCDDHYWGIINTTEALCESMHKGKVVEGVTCKTSFAVIEAGSEEECTTVYYGEVLPG